MCKKNILCSTGSYGNLRRHVDKMHSFKIKQYDDLWRNRKKRSHDEDESGTPGKQSKIGNFYGGPRTLAKQESSVVTQQNLDDAVLAFVYGCNQPFAIVDKPEFRDLVLLGKESMKIFSPGYNFYN